jgi:flavin-dependent dehydrogenase
MVQRFDLAIVGGSFAGLACARSAALRGLKVAVLDAKPDPGVRVRTTGIVVKEASDTFDLPARMMRKVPGVRLYAPDNRALDLSAPGYFFQATDMPALMRWMAEEAERAGATLMFGKKFDGGLEYERGIAMGDLHASFLVGADGAKSRVAEVFGLGQNRRFLAGLEIECEPLDGVDGRFLHCFADSKIAPGYIAWMVPGVGATQIGLAASRPQRPELGAFLRRLKHFLDLREIRVTSRRSGLVPCGGVVPRLGSRRVMLVGDAAGMVSPVTGGGIHTALHYGRRAAVLIANHLGHRGPDPATALAREAPRFGAKLWLRRAMDIAPPNIVINALLMTEPARRLAQRLYFHSRGESGESFEAWSRDFAKQDQVARGDLRLV